MVIQIKVTGLKETQKFLANMPKAIEKEALIKSEDFMRSVQKSAKLRAPKDTGFLASQIKLTRTKNTITVDTGDAYYAYFQEFGFKPHLIPFEYFEQHYTSPAVSGIFASPISGFSWVSTKHPFMLPALEAAIPRLPNMMINAVNDAITKSRR